MASGANKRLRETISAAVDDLAQHGYDSAERLAFWQRRIKEAAEAALKPADFLRKALKDVLAKVYRKQIENGAIVKMHPGIGRFTLQQVAPRLRAELDRRILASADLIKLNREQAIGKTLQRFAGWSTSIPAGGSEVVSKRQAKRDIGKSLAQLPFEERRVLIDQGHKLTSSLNEILAQDGGAIAEVWHSHYRQAGYNYRPDHKARDGKVYAMRGGWAFDKGLAKVGPAGWNDQITRPGEEPFCRCYVSYIYNLRDLPSDMLTAKGREALQAAQAA